LTAVISSNVFWHGSALVQLGQIELGLSELSGVIADLYRFVRSPVGSLLFPGLADVYLRAGRREQGLKTVAEGLKVLENNGARLGEAELRRLNGELLMLDSDAGDEAEGSFREAIEVARRQSAKWFELRATASLARLLVKRARTGEARTMLAEIYNWFTEGFDTADLKDAKSLLDELDT
jgi:predicted ATPase